LYSYLDKRSGYDDSVYAIVFEVDAKRGGENKHRDIFKKLEYNIAFLVGSEDEIGLKRSLRVQGVFEDVYKKEPADNYIKEWAFFFWINDQPMPKGVMVNEPHVILLRLNPRAR
jgi:hypothetical protein